MSPSLPTVKAKECLRALERYGFYVHHQTGSHARLFHRTDPTRKVTIPIHNKDLPAGTLKSILRQAGISIADFVALL